MWRGVTAVSTLRDDLTFIVSVSLRKYAPFRPHRFSIQYAVFHQDFPKLPQNFPKI